MVADVNADSKPGPKPKPSGRQLRPVQTARDERPILDLDPADVSEEIAIGTEALAPPVEDETAVAVDRRNTLVIRGIEYPLPRLGPLVLVAADDLDRRSAEAQSKRDALLRSGKSDIEASNESGYYNAVMEWLRFIWDVAQDVVPRTILMSLQMSEVQELRSQIRPFDGGAGSASQPGQS